MDIGSALQVCHEAKSSGKPQRLDFMGSAYMVSAVDGGWLISDSYGMPMATRATVEEVASYISEHEAAQAKAKEIMDKAMAKADEVMTMATRLDMMVKHEGDEWVVYDKSGKKVLGRHKSKQDAMNQLAAIEASKHADMKSCDRVIEVMSVGTWNGYKFTLPDLVRIVDESNRFLKYL